MEYSTIYRTQFQIKRAQQVKLSQKNGDQPLRIHKFIKLVKIFLPPFHAWTSVKRSGVAQEISKQIVIEFQFWRNGVENFFYLRFIFQMHQRFFTMVLSNFSSQASRDFWQGTYSKLLIIVKLPFTQGAIIEITKIRGTGQESFLQLFLIPVFPFSPL